VITGIETGDLKVVSFHFTLLHSLVKRSFGRFSQLIRTVRKKVIYVFMKMVYYNSKIKVGYGIFII